MFHHSNQLLGQIKEEMTLNGGGGGRSPVLDVERCSSEEPTDLRVVKAASREDEPTTPVMIQVSANIDGGASSRRRRSLYSPENEDQNDVGNSSKRRRPRTTFRHEQIAQLEAIFRQTHYPDVYTRERLSTQTKISEEKIQIWFQNRRSKWRKRERLSCKHPEKELYNAITQAGNLVRQMTAAADAADALELKNTEHPDVGTGGLFLQQAASSSSVCSGTGAATSPVQSLVAKEDVGTSKKSSQRKDKERQTGKRPGSFDQRQSGSIPAASGVTESQNDQGKSILDDFRFLFNSAVAYEDILSGLQLMNNLPFLDTGFLCRRLVSNGGLPQMPPPSLPQFVLPFLPAPNNTATHQPPPAHNSPAVPQLDLSMLQQAFFALQQQLRNNTTPAPAAFCDSSSTIQNSPTAPVVPSSNC